jgi:hypothetical protein
MTLVSRIPPPQGESRLRVHDPAGCGPPFAIPEAVREAVVWRLAEIVLRREAAEAIAAARVLLDLDRLNLAYERLERERGAEG